MSSNSATVRDVCFVDENTVAAVGGGDFGVRLWDASAPSADALAVLHGHSDTVFGVRSRTQNQVWRWRMYGMRVVRFA